MSSWGWWAILAWINSPKTRLDTSSLKAVWAKRFGQKKEELSRAVDSPSREQDLDWVHVSSAYG